MERFRLAGFNLHVWLLAFLALLSCGCAGSSLCPDPDVRRHVVIVDSDGRPIDPTDNQTILTTRRDDAGSSRTSFRGQLDEMFQAMAAFHAAHPGGPAAGGAPRSKKKILIFVHGGLNSLADSRGNAVRVYQEMAKDSAVDAFPIFLDWQSDFLSTYGEELRSIRIGTKDRNPVSGPLYAPLYFTADLGRALAGAPVTLFNQFIDDYETVAGAAHSITHAPAPSADVVWDNPRLRNAGAFYRRLRQRYQDNFQSRGQPAIAISLGTDVGVPWPEWISNGSSYLATFPFKLVSGPLINGLGKPAWDNMCRRTTMMFIGPEVFDTTGKSDAEIDEALRLGNHMGAVSIFLDRLQSLVRGTGAESDYEITLIGHSMGTIVANNILTRYPQLPVKNIVYMAAACSILDFQHAVLRFMDDPAHRDCQFYNLCLHPLAETLDIGAWDLVPRGSLLLWIDNYLERPRSPLDRTLGRFENILETSFIFPESMYDRIHLKAFDLLSSRAPEERRHLQPQKHGDFSGVDFWKPEFWQPLPPQSP